MKKKVLSALLTATLLFSIGMPAFATPNEEVIENQAKYDELTAKIDEITGQVYALDAEIEPLMETIENNKAEVEEIKIEVENTEKEIEKSEEVLGKRIREFYKSGGQVNYLTLLFSAESFNDLISKIDSTTRIVNIDKELIAELEEKKANLNEKVTVLEERKAEVIKLTEESEAALDELNAKKAEQEIAIEQLNAEQEEFEKNYLSVSERKLVAHQQSVLETSNDKNELQAAIDQLTSIRDNQIKSEIVKQEISDSIYYGTIKLEEIIEAEEAEEAAKAAAQQQISSPNRGEITSGTASSASGNAIVSYAYNFIGTPYVYGATGPDTFDCSGFTSYVYANAAGIDITRTTYSQMGVGTPVSYDELQPGDLVFTYGGDHVGIYVGGGQYIHAPQPGDSVKVSNITSFYSARRVL